MENVENNNVENVVEIDAVKSAEEVTAETMSAISAILSRANIKHTTDGGELTIIDGESEYTLRLPKERDGRYTADDIDAVLRAYISTCYQTDIAGYKAYVASQKADNAEVKLPSSAYINGFDGLKFSQHIAKTQKALANEFLANQKAQAEETARLQAKANELGLTVLQVMVAEEAEKMASAETLVESA